MSEKRSECRPRGKKLLQLAKALEPVTWYHKLDFVAACPCCKKKTALGELKKVLRVSQKHGELEKVEVKCTACGADEDAVCAALGEVKEVLQMSRAGLETIGMNRCTTCIHYKHERYGGDHLVGCMKRNEFKLNAPWELNEIEVPCNSYVIDLTVVEKVLPYVEGQIDASSELLAQLKNRRKVLRDVLAEYEAAKPVSADGFEEKEKAPQNEAREELTAGR